MEKVKNGFEKQRAYTQNFRLMNKALKEEFYLEAVSICYAVLEDRLVSFLHHAGIVSRDNPELKINRSVYPYIRILMNKDSKYSVKVKDISVKMSIIRLLINMDENRAKEIDAEVQCTLNSSKKKRRVLAPGYMECLFQQIQNSLDAAKIEQIFTELDSWRTARNILIHALLSQTVASSEQSKKKCAEAGKELARAIDYDLVKPFKEGNKIRKKYNIQ